MGQGNSGLVVLVKKKTTKTHYAMKIMSKHKLTQSYSDCLHQLDAEVRVLKAISHPFIIGLAYSFQNPQFCMIVMELAAGDLI